MVPAYLLSANRNSTVNAREQGVAYPSSWGRGPLQRAVQEEGSAPYLHLCFPFAKWMCPLRRVLFERS